MNNNYGNQYGNNQNYNNQPNSYQNSYGYNNMQNNGQGYYNQQYNQGYQRYGNGFGIVSLVLGVMSLVLFFTILFPIILGILSIIFGIIHITRKSNKGFGIAGITLSIIGIVCGIVFCCVISNIDMTHDIDSYDSHQYVDDYSGGENSIDDYSQENDTIDDGQDYYGSSEPIYGDWVDSLTRFELEFYEDGDFYLYSDYGNYSAKNLYGQYNKVYKGQDAIDKCKDKYTISQNDLNDKNKIYYLELQIEGAENGDNNNNNNNDYNIGTNLSATTYNNKNEMDVIIILDQNASIKAKIVYLFNDKHIESSIYKKNY